MGVLRGKYERGCYAAVCKRDQQDGGDIYLCIADGDAVLPLQRELESAVVAPRVFPPKADLIWIHLTTEACKRQGNPEGSFA